MTWVYAKNPFSIDTPPQKSAGRPTTTQAQRLGHIQARNQTFAQASAQTQQASDIGLRKLNAVSTQRDSVSSFDVNRLARIRGNQQDSDRFESSALNDTQAGLLQSLSTPARKRDAVPLETHVNDSTVTYADTVDQGWIAQLKEGFMDMFFEPLPEVAASENNPISQPESTIYLSTDKPIGLARLTRFTFASPMQPQRTQMPVW